MDDKTKERLKYVQENISTPGMLAMILMGWAERHGAIKPEMEQTAEFVRGIYRAMKMDVPEFTTVEMIEELSKLGLIADKYKLSDELKDIKDK